MGSGVGVAETDPPVLLGLVGHTLPPYRLNNKLLLELIIREFQHMSVFSLHKCPSSILSGGL